MSNIQLDLEMMRSQTIESEWNKIRKILLKKYHPDSGGNSVEFNIINSETFEDTKKYYKLTNGKDNKEQKKLFLHTKNQQYVENTTFLCLSGIIINLIGLLSLALGIFFIIIYYYHFISNKKYWFIAMFVMVAYYKQNM